MRHIWELDIQQGWYIGLAIVAVLLVLSVGAVVLAATQPVSILTFLLAMLAVVGLAITAHISYALWGLVNAVYEMDRNALVIRWGGRSHQIPMAAIQEVRTGDEVAPPKMRFGIRWPGYFVGHGQDAEHKPILFYATRPPTQQLIIRTATADYAISPADAEEFLQALIERLEMGPTHEVEETATHPAILDWRIWRDRWAMGMLGLGLGTFLLLLAALCWRYPYLPAQIIMRADAHGHALLVAPAARIFHLALIGGVILLLNDGLGLYLYLRERMASYFLWSGLLLLEGSLWIAFLMILAQQL